ncbi:MAG: alpha/beta hydrolase [Marinobacter sp.]|uniref:alpha/beta hydrolase n=1 Tax=Marinobacter sp. TaxID=50741 RepID=UPI0034A046EB
MADSDTRHIRLADGRNMSYSDTGSGENGIWLHCHGIPGSRNELAHLTDRVSGKGYRVIIPDRPGYGSSSPHPDYQFTDHSDDLKQLSDHLNLRHFALTGFSGGGVFALTAAHDLATRVSELAIAATPAVPLMQNPFAHASEMTASIWHAALKNPTELAQEMEVLTGDPGSLAEALISAAGAVEGRFLLSKGIRDYFTANLTMAVAQGTKIAAQALVRDTCLMVSDWKIKPGDLNLSVIIIHGEEDRLVYQEHQSVLLAWLPTARGLVLAKCGHFEVLSGLIRDS